MKRTIGMKSIVALGMGTSLVLWVSSKPNRIKLENTFRDLKRKVKPSAIDKSNSLPVEKGGHPDPQDIEDNKMVSEGAMYSVKFYNEKKQ
ncbi:hypothetical protein WQ54_01015 [Bacillus sp. SA1-12]|uniref:hypothetical protein n=1 Tax=Bacillus sp. SA1-12 TaxID=1455638 RepID=UPI000625EFB2|nr:hypothetical protein [Bacillus sp. SA1-12]KKI94148.1 hypothetical protein WQ54_01015 [Bacillus sp. SA1-12]